MKFSVRNINNLQRFEMNNIKKIQIYYKAVFYTVVMVSLISCKTETRTYESIIIVKTNMEVLLDSIDMFDWTQIPTPIQNNFSDKQFQVEVIDTILYEANYKEIFRSKINANNLNYNFYTYKLDSTFIQQPKTKSIKLVEKSTNDIYTLTIYFSNLFITESNKFASIIVTKVIGNSMTKDIYFFEKKNNKWKLLNKKNILIG
ncbi:hypothetical protein K5I29_13235 [Flavobacterium agricola]|uniref:Lipoprotein n=1 Tax=Flavobacterium agricola TaxID=2870839 RepID=A0ABY6LYG5_9FLAO|nr:hypothetical protein [Flavobacterium agricola]UYW01372.1 hypothetical protein K5I29_13235 [Flavobacterium agricola]